MNFFRPAEIRAILVLSILVFAGSFLTLLKRQGSLSRLDLDTLISEGRYDYSYNLDRIRKKSPERPPDAQEPDPDPPATVSREYETIDLNHAGFFDLQTLPGIGPVLAERIIAYRDSVGFFSSPEQLLNVEGIGRKKYERLKDRISLE